MSNESIVWELNLSKAPWQDGQSEWLNGLIKQTRYITIAKAHLKWTELEKVLLDIEVKQREEDFIASTWQFSENDKSKS